MTVNYGLKAVACTADMGIFFFFWQHHKVRTEEEIKRTMWIVENDEACRLMTAHGGAAFHGFQAPFGPAVDWQHQKGQCFSFTIAPSCDPSFLSS